MAEVRINDYRLMRARHGRMAGGVAAGLARASGMDVTYVRLCMGAMMLAGFGVPVYILMWIILPEESPARGRGIQPAPEPTARYIRIAIVVLGVLSLLNKVGGFVPFASPHTRGFGFGGAIGLVLLGVGITILFSRHRPDRGLWQPANARDDDPRLDGEDEPRTFSGPFGEAMGTVQDALSDAFTEVRTTFKESRPQRTPSSSSRTYPDEDAYYDDYLDDEPEPAPRSSRIATATATVDGDIRHSGGAALAWARVIGWLCLIWWTLSAVATVGLWAIGAVSVRSPILLGVVGWLVFIAVLNTILHARFARAIIPALALLLIPVGVAAATVRPVGEIGQHDSAPQTVTQSTKNYRLGLGRLDLNFADTDFASANTTINARTGAGAIFVTVPNDVTVKVNTRTEAGAYEVFGQTSHGVSPRRSFNFQGCEGAKKLTLNLRTGAGYIQVHRANGHTGRTCTAAA